MIAGDRQRETERVEMWRAHWQRDIAAESSVTMLSPQALCGLLAGSGQTGREEGLTSIFAKHRETTNYRQREIIWLSNRKPCFAAKIKRWQSEGRPLSCVTGFDQSCLTSITGSYLPPFSNGSEQSLAVASLLVKPERFLAIPHSPKLFSLLPKSEKLVTWFLILNTLSAATGHVRTHCTFKFIRITSKNISSPNHK